MDGHPPSDTHGSLNLLTIQDVAKFDASGDVSIDLN